MRGKYKIALKQIVKDFNLQIINKAPDYENTMLSTADVNRPAMQLTGFYNYFDPHRIQIIGRVESTYLDTLTHEERLEAFERFMQYDIPALVICHGVVPSSECLEMAARFGRNVFYTDDDTSDFQANVIAALHTYLAPRITTHGVLVEVYGEGLLITGKSGIGKSETALELLKRGHRLIADDAVEIKRVRKDTLIGNAPAMIQYYMELRGIGVVNVRQIYGVGAIKPESSIDLVVEMEPWDDNKVYDRLGLTGDSEEILGVTLPKVVIPVHPGRNLAVIIELAAMNNRQKKMGFNAAETLAADHDNAIDNNLF